MSSKMDRAKDAVVEFSKPPTRRMNFL